MKESQEKKMSSRSNTKYNDILIAQATRTAAAHSPLLPTTDIVYGITY